MRLSEEVLRQGRAIIASRLGLDFSEVRRQDLERGLVRALRTAATSEPEEFLAWLGLLPANDPEWRRLAAHLTVGETYFFRDRACFEALETRILPDLIASRREDGIRRLRLWSAACATGEEPYSLAILLDRLLPDRADWGVTILATDINGHALEAARRGHFRDWAFRETPGAIRQRYFKEGGAGTFELDPEIRRMVTFAPLNLAGDGYPALVTNTTVVDVLLCRNVLMYFTREAQRATAERLRGALAPGGWLAVSPAEASADLFRPLVQVSLGAIFYRKEPGGASSPSARSAAQAVSPRLRPEPLSVEPLAVAPPAPPTAPRSAEARAAPDRAAQLARARALADHGELEPARTLCQALLAGDRLDPETHLLLAAICQEQGEPAAAMEALRRALYVAPDSAPAHFLMGSLLFQHGERRRARRAMETVVGLLASVDRDEVLAGSDGLTAGRLLETAQGYLESR